MAIKATELLDELDLAYRVMRATDEAWPVSRIESIVQAVQEAADMSTASQLQSQLLRLSGSAEDAAEAARWAGEQVEEAIRIVRARQESDFKI